MKGDFNFTLTNGVTKQISLAMYKCFPQMKLMEIPTGVSYSLKSSSKNSNSQVLKVLQFTDKYRCCRRNAL